MVLTNFSNGSVLDADDLNDNFEGNRVLEVYTGSDFDTSVSDNDSETNSYELTAIPSSSVNIADYLNIEVMGYSSVRARDQTCYTRITIEVKEIGGAYSTIFNKYHLYFGGGSDGFSMKNNSPFRYLHTLTAGEKSNGLQIKVSSTSVTGNDTGASESASFSNNQTILRLEVSN